MIIFVAISPVELKELQLSKEALKAAVLSHLEEGVCIDGKRVDLGGFNVIVQESN
jgi:hypothetical protein